MKIGVYDANAWDGVLLERFKRYVSSDDIQIVDGDEGVDVVVACRQPETVYGVPLVRIVDEALDAQSINFDAVTFVLILSDRRFELAPMKYVRKFAVMPVLGGSGVPAWQNFFRQYGPKPALNQKIMSYVGSTVRHVASGLERATDRAKAHRLAVCQSCPFLNPDRTCSRCGCPVDAKADRATEKCPMGYWEKEKGQEAADEPLPAPCVPCAQKS